jgi:D-galactarolactone cycloisomerase
MNIINIEAFVLTDKLDQSFYFSQWKYSQRKICLVKITAEDGTTGWGEGYGPADVLAAGVKYLSKYVIGQNPLNSEVIWGTLYRRTLDYARSGILMAAVSAIDVAVWDLKGKILGMPVHQLLGGKKRDKIYPYATGLYFREEKDLTRALADEAIKYKELGYRAIKMKVGLSIKEDVKNVKAVREAIGEDTELYIDANHAYNLREAIKLSRALEDFDIGWFEEPISPEHYEQFAELRNKTSIPVATGECEYLSYGFHRLLKNSAADILQPDICAAGGLTETKKIAALAGTYGIEIIPHSWGTYVAISAAMHFVANLDCIPGRLKKPKFTLEHDRTSNSLRDYLTTPDFEIEDGALVVSDKPGLGVEVNESALEKYLITNEKIIGNELRI